MTTASSFAFTSAVDGAYEVEIAGPSGEVLLIIREKDSARIQWAIVHPPGRGIPTEFGTGDDVLRALCLLWPGLVAPPEQGP